MHPEDVRIVFRHLPLIGTPEEPFHDKAALSSQAAEAAGRQDKFWEMHDFLFEHQAEWSQMTPEQFQEWLQGQAGELGLDEAQFAADLVDEEIVSKVQGAYDWGASIGLLQTPFLLVNGQPMPDNFPMDLNNLSALVQMFSLQDRQFATCPPMDIDPSKQYVAVLHTEKGDIEIELFADRAPMAVNNFIFLARQGWYDNITFHRVLPGFVAQTGDPTGTGFGGPGYAFDNEVFADLKFDGPGVVGMANSGAGSNGSQFFITFAEAPRLDGGYTIFGRVISGMDVAESLTPRDPSADMGLPPGDKLISVTIEER